mmetsp:Transcript_99993/g.288692  ORF Transcript_99993/g.288692 Transcript_99993/m.288692 type:complete len:164 (+) Transcript_99993:175-666(+)
MGCHRDCQKFIAAGFVNSFFSLGFSLRIECDKFLWNRHLILPQTFHITASKSSGGAAGIYKTRNLHFLTIFDDTKSAFVIDFVVFFSRVKRTHQCCNMIHHVELWYLLKGGGNRRLIAKISFRLRENNDFSSCLFLHLFKSSCQGFIGSHQIKGNDGFGTSFQ